MIQVQNVQQQPQGIVAELYSQVEDYMAKGESERKVVLKLSGKSDSSKSSSSSGKVTVTRSHKADENTLGVKINGKTVYGDAAEIVERMVEAEMGPSFQEEALKAQAVAAYTYVRYHNEQGTCPSVVAKDTVSSKVRDAVDQVIGEAIYYKGKYINSTYCASNAGQSMDSEHVWGGYLPYLVSVESPGDTSLKAYGATKTFSEQEIADYLEDSLGVDPYSYGDPDEWFSNPEYINGLYVDTIDVCGQTVSGRAVREDILDFQINSPAFEVSYDGDSFTFTTYGYGHGVGMSQQGADYYAMRGWDYTEILSHYYTGVDIY